MKADITKKTAAFAKVYTFADTTAPAIKSIVSETNGTSASSATITFTEAVAAGAAIKINGTYVGNTDGDNEVTVSGTFATATTHKVEVVTVSDLASTANTVALLKGEFTVTVDTTAPVASVAAATDKKITITFSKKMTVADVTAANAIKVIDGTALTAVTASSVTVVADTDNKKFEVSISNDPFASVSSKTYFVQVAADLRDYLGNKTTAANLSVTLTKDATKPVATSLTTTVNADGKTTHLKVTFSENLLASSSVARPTTIVDANGVLVANADFPGALGADGVVSDNTVSYALTTATSLTGIYTFNFGSGIVTDQSFAANTNDAKSFTVNFGAAAAAGTTFEVSTIANTTSSTIQTIVVTFAEEVVGGANAGSATDVANYSINGSALPAGTTITLNAAKKVATITIPEGGFTAADSAAVFTVAGVKATSGKSLVAKTSTLAIVDTTKPVLVSAQLVSTTQVMLTYDSDIAGEGTVGNGTFIFAQDGTTFTAGTVTGASVSGYDKKVLVTLTNALDTSKTLTIKTTSLAITDTAANANAQKADVTVTIAK